MTKFYCWWVIPIENFKNQKLRAQDLRYFSKKYEHSWIHFGLRKGKRNEKKAVRAILKGQRQRRRCAKKENLKRGKRSIVKNYERANYIWWEKIEISSWNGEHTYVPCILGDSYIFGWLLI